MLHEYIRGFVLKVADSGAKLHPAPLLAPVANCRLPLRLTVDPELSNEEFEYILEAGAEPFPADWEMQ